LKDLLLPAIALAAPQAAITARVLRTALLETMNDDYVRTARAKGLVPRRIIGVHAMRNSLSPVVTFLAVDLGALMGGAIITETIFNIPGLGRAVFDSVRQQEGTVVVGIATFLVVVYMLSSLLVDVLYSVLDPRIRYE
jgi:peptide/nickel transport system permease protein/oligopeptide transport system permease protein